MNVLDEWEYSKCGKGVMKASEIVYVPALSAFELHFCVSD